jgi:hypothetical protein
MYDFLRRVAMICLGLSLWFFETDTKNVYSSQLTKIAWHPSIRCTNDTCVVFSRYHGWTKKCTYPKNNKILKLKGKLI